jgi:Tol biopolymer transport system component
MRGIGRVAALLLLATLPARAQSLRPWLNWQTVETEHFVLHFPDQYREWTMALAARAEGVRDQVGAMVGYLPDERVHIVVDDPVNDANGTAWTTLDAPTVVLWPTPPDPREEIGNFRVWNELLLTHEFAHVAHLTRPSRNHWKNLLWAISPVPLGPIAVESPRWVIEGYATYIEGKVTGTGRPNHAWRAAVLRQFAIEGRLPSYSAVSATGGWETGSFAYLAGSAYFEWLARREGDSSVTALWRRLTAKTTRSFDEAFIGVYGNGPAQLYGRFVAELTADALSFERSLARDAMVTGTLVQRLTRNTGDPAISPDGRFVALTIRHPDAPSELVVWRTADDPDTAAVHRRELQLRKDPEDVPDRSFYPPAKRAVISLIATDGAPYETPRWLPDNRHLLLTRLMPLSDGTLRPDLFMWSAEDGSIVRVTRGAAVRDADPSPDGASASAVRCEHGWCDLVQVDLASGAVRLLVAGNVTHNFYRPRVSKRTGEIVVAEQTGDRWRIARVNPHDGSLRYADPDDGAIRYDATFEPDGRTIVTTSEATGIANLERLDAVDGHATPLTAVTGAAVAADVAPDGAIWFLSLHASGYDLRRLRPDSASLARAARAAAPARIALIDTLSPVLPPRTNVSAADSSRRPRVGPVGTVHPYGVGPDRLRYVPAAISSFGGSSFLLSLVRTDPVGRLTGVLTGSAGAAALPAGVSLRLLSSYSRTGILLDGWDSHATPSREYGPAYAEGLDLSRYGGAFRIQRAWYSDGGEFTGAFGGLLEHQVPAGFEASVRGATLLNFSLVRRQRDLDSRYIERLDALGEAGSNVDGSYLRQRSAILLGVGGNAGDLVTARASYGTVGGGDGSWRELYTIGGFTSPLIDAALDARRVDMPAYPVGSGIGSTFSSYRVGVPLPPLDLFFSAASPDQYRTSFRSYGAELRAHLPSYPPLGTPQLDVLTGFARALDFPVAKEWRYYLSVVIKP